VITAVAAEFLKFRRSITARIATTLVVAAGPSMALGMVALARSGAIVGPSQDKFAVALEGSVNEAHLALAGQMLTVVMLIAAGFVAVWIFGREYSDRTVGALYALPVSRATVGWAKLIVCGSWTLAVVSAALVAILAGSWIINADGVTDEVMAAAGQVWIAGALMGLLGVPFGLIAVLTRGYLGGVGAIIAAAAVGQILASLGIGAWIPYVAPAMWVGAGGDAAAVSVGVPHLALALAAGVLASAAAAVAFGRSRLS